MSKNKQRRYNYIVTYTERLATRQVKFKTLKAAFRCIYMNKKYLSVTKFTISREKRIT